MIKFASLLIVSVLFLGCSAKDEEVIPNVQFSGTLNMLEANHLVTSFTERTDMVRRPLGYAGVVVYRLTEENYYVYDLMCPHEKSVGSLVKIVETGGAVVKCPTCGSEYLLSGGYGDVIKGPTKYPLKAYQNRYNSTNNYLEIWN